jgi:hypothetical protein
MLSWRRVLGPREDSWRGSMRGLLAYYLQTFVLPSLPCQAKSKCR